MTNDNKKNHHQNSEITKNDTSKQPPKPSDNGASPLNEGITNNVSPRKNPIDTKSSNE